MLHGGDLPILARERPDELRRLFKSDRIFAPSRYLLDGVCQPMGLAGSVIPNPIDRHSYPARRRSSVSARLFWLRAFHEKYRPHLAIQALAKIRQTVPDAKLVMAGPDKDGTMAACRQLVSELGLEEAVDFAGLVDKPTLKRLGAEHDIFLNTTSVDNTPVTLVEAMAMGLCIVSTNVGGIPFLVEDERHALLVPPDDVDALAEAVLRLLREPDLADRLSGAGLERADTFDRQTVVQAWEAVLFPADEHP